MPRIASRRFWHSWLQCGRQPHPACLFPEALPTLLPSALSVAVSRSAESRGDFRLNLGSLFTSSRSLAADIGNVDSKQATAHPASELTEQEFALAVNDTLEDIFTSLETLLDDHDIPGSDLELSEGVVRIDLGEHGTYVLNKQAPNKQLWMSSPVSGPVRYDYREGSWIYIKDGHDMHDRLTDELSKIFGAVRLRP